ncbi:MAG TPA: MMPL family transporter [Candidatus Dormibacteraeota bacterium]|nr:MMPL family transporter [Candidatus Dormibacteraeota bacterium]
MSFRRIGELAARYRRWVLGAWVAVAIVLNVVVPQLTDVIRRDTVPFVPASAEVMRGYDVMSRQFNGGHAGGDAIVVLENAHGITTQDRAYYAQLVATVRAATQRVVDVQDYIHHPEFEQSAISRDGKAIYLPVMLRAEVSTPQADSDAVWLRSVVQQHRPSDLQVDVTGDTAIIADFQKSVQDSTARTTVITGLLVILILLAIYRSPVTPIIPLTVIGLSIAVVRPVVAFLGLHVIQVAAFTETFILAIVFGAGTDYCIFMISRFREQMAGGDSRRQAIGTSTRRVGEAIASSAITVMVGGLSMLPAHVSLFSTTGPAIAVAVAVTLVAGLTLTPALLAMDGDRFFWPRRARTEHHSRFWTGAAGLITRKPGRVALAGLIPLLLLAALYPTMRLTYDERSPQPATNDSVQGLAALSRHYPGGEIMPTYVLVSSNHDMRNARDLAALDTATKSLSKLDGVASVRSFTQPLGARLQQASIPYQDGVVAQGLDSAQSAVQQGSAGAQQLSQGAGALSGGAAQVAQGASQAQGATAQLAAGLSQENSGLQQLAGGAASAGQGAADLATGAQNLAAGLRVARSGVQQAVDGMTQVLVYFQSDPRCAVGDPSCTAARDGLTRIRDGERDQLLPGLDQAIAGADRIAGGDGSLAAGAQQLRDGIVQAQQGLVALQQGEEQFGARLAQLSSGAQRLSSGAQQLGGGVDQLAGGTTALSSGLGQAAAFLSQVQREAGAAGIDTFYIPGDRLDDPQLALARYYYMSPDGRTARLMVFGKDDPFGIAAMDRTAQERSAVDGALRGTSLGGAQVLLAGFSAQNDAIRSYFQQDFRLVAIVVLLGVFLVLVLLLRSLVAPLYLLASVVLSYAGAMGLTTLIWQDAAHMQAIDWTVPIFAFMMLVSVGADYNIFLMSRVREEVRRDPVNGIARAVTRTGAIITSAGVIFAGTFAALITSPLNSIAEAGTAITLGLLLDTFVVRSFVVPAVAVLLGRLNWWPSGYALKTSTRPETTRVRRVGRAGSLYG